MSFAWSSSSSVRAEALNWYARYFTPHAVQRLVRLATDAARDLAPHRAADLEMHLQRVLAEQGPWRYERGDVAVTCQPDVSVRLDEHLKQARCAEQLSQRWIGILEGAAHVNR
ncbi:hypothetical protein AB0J20_21885 [Micromonospora costi]|uniref:hypothetical protein n=1 Tax=Micromonospora costi TaxID=1530042 RepID=UPI0033E36461